MKYVISYIPESGQQYDLSGVTVDCEIAEQEEELATSCKISLANTKVGSSWLSDLLKIPHRIVTSTDTTEMFRGIITTYDYESGINKDIEIETYDNSWYMQRSKESLYVPPGSNSEKLIKDLLTKNGVPYTYNGPSVIISAEPYRSQTIAEIILDILKKAKKLSPTQYILRSSLGVIEILPRGSNTAVYQLNIQNVENVHQNMNIEKMVTVVKVLYTDKDSNFITQEAELTNNLEYGRIVDIVYRSSNQTLAEARGEAQEILNENSKPENTLSFTSVDVPFLRKGDKINIIAGPVSGDFYVGALAHDLKQGKMKVDLLS